MNETQNKVVRGKTFEVWLRMVDAACIKRVGMSSSDLVDICYRDMWEDGVSPDSAARRAIKATGGDGL